MSEENKNEDEIAEEMMRMMEEEVGGDEGAGESDAEESDSDIDLEAAMRQAMGEETSAPEGDGGDGLEAQMLEAMMAETSAETPQAAETALHQTQTMLPGVEFNAQNISRLMGIDLSITIELGHTHVPISILLDWSEGSLIELDKVSGEDVDVLINGKLFAKGEVVTIAENFGVRLVEILPTVPRSI